MAGTVAAMLGLAALVAAAAAVISTELLPATIAAGVGALDAAAGEFGAAFWNFVWFAWPARCDATVDAIRPKIGFDCGGAIN